MSIPKKLPRLNMMPKIPKQIISYSTMSMRSAVESMLDNIGENRTREGLRDTPDRVAAAWREWTAGYERTAASVLKSFADGAYKGTEMVVVRGIPMYSQCEHHMAAFFGVVHIAYIPNGRIVGLSKFPRLVDVFAKRLQVQERITNQIADAIVEHVKPRGVGVIVSARHMCLESRGVCKPGTTTQTSALRGVLLTKPEARAEFFSLLR